MGFLTVCDHVAGPANSKTRNKATLSLTVKVGYVSHMIYGVSRILSRSLISSFIYESYAKCNGFQVQTCISIINFMFDKKVTVSHSLIAVGAVGVRIPLYLGHS